MRDQYASDISDFLKFSFLRAIAQQDHRLGVAWYYLPGHDGGPDGRHHHYKKDRHWRELDPDVYDDLAAMPQPSVAGLESLGFWPKDVIFHNTPITARKRADWVKVMVNTMTPAQIVFVDPDNGLGKGATKHARITDVTSLKLDTRAISLIKFPGRNKSHVDQMHELHRSLLDNGFRNALTVNTCVHVPYRGNRSAPRHRFFTIANAGTLIRERAIDFVARVNTLHESTRVRASFHE